MLPTWNELPETMRVKLMREAESLGCGPCCSDAMQDAVLSIYRMLREELAEMQRAERQAKAYAELFPAAHDPPPHHPHLPQGGHHIRPRERDPTDQDTPRAGCSI